MSDIAGVGRRSRVWIYIPCRTTQAMPIRHVEESDRPRLQEIARRSMESSYSLSPSAINGAVETWYGPDGFAEKLADTDLMLMIVELEDEPVAFSESTAQGERGDVLWLHVDPMYRGQGIGNELYEATVEALSERGPARSAAECWSITRRAMPSTNNRG